MEKLSADELSKMQNLADALNENNATMSSASEWKLDGDCIRLNGLSKNDSVILRKALKEVNIMFPWEKHRKFRDTGLISVIMPDGNGKIACCIGLNQKTGFDIDFTAEIIKSRFNESFIKVIRENQRAEEEMKRLIMAQHER